MSDNINSPEKVGPAADIEPAPVPNPSSTFYSEMVAVLIAAVDHLIQSIPEFDTPVVTTEFVERKRRLSPLFVSRAVNALLVNPELQEVKPLNAAQTIDDKQFIDAFEPLEAHLTTALKGLKRVIAARRARLNAAAELIYLFGKALAQDRDATTIHDHVDTMKRSRHAPRRSRKRNPAAEAARKGGERQQQQ